jgi:biopolymer transport protein ExbB/TolQ
MIPLKIPADHPHAPIIQRWAKDKESILDGHGQRLKAIENVLKTILSNSPDLGKST